MVLEVYFFANLSTSKYFNILTFSTAAMIIGN